MSNNYCTSCGAKLEDNQKFCSSCGNSIESSIKKEINKEENVVSEKKTNGLAIAGFVVSLVSSLICCGVFNIISLVLSIVGLVKTKDFGGDGKGLAIAGIIISVVFTVIALIFYIILVVANNYEYPYI